MNEAPYRAQLIWLMEAYDAAHKQNIHLRSLVKQLAHENKAVMREADVMLERERAKIRDWIKNSMRPSYGILADAIFDRAHWNPSNWVEGGNVEDPMKKMIERWEARKKKVRERNAFRKSFSVDGRRRK